MISDSFVTFVQASSGVAAVSSPSPKIYLSVLPQNHADPAITFDLDDEIDGPLFDGISTLKEALIDTQCWSTSPVLAETLGHALYSALAGYRGAFGDYTADHIRRERKFILYEPDTLLFRVSQQFRIAFY